MTVELNKLKQGPGPDEEPAAPAVEKPVEPQDAAVPAAGAAAGNGVEPAPAAADVPSLETVPVLVSEPAPEAQPDAEDASAQSAPALPGDKVLEHTALLWKYKPIPVGEPDPAPEYLQEFTALPGSVITAARVRGKKHKHEGSNCDDWYETANLGTITFLAVSDGAGSKRFSRIGARESCKAAVGYLVRSCEELLTQTPGILEDLKLELSDPKCMDACRAMATLTQQAVVKAYDAVEAAYYSRSTDRAYSDVLGRSLTFKDFSGTLLLTVIVPIREETKEHLIITCQIGDGMTCVLNSEAPFASSLRLMGVPDGGEYSGETDFLTSPQMKTIEALQKRTKLYRGTVDTVLSMTDGVADDYFPNETEMRRLYCDLVVNGVIGSAAGRDLSKVSPEGLKQFRKLPDPLAYPWVNDQSVRIPLHYTRRILEATGCTLEALWEDRALLELARMEIVDPKNQDDPGERLKIWLDNYVERGSFDDRTLVIAHL